MLTASSLYNISSPNPKTKLRSSRRTSTCYPFRLLLLHLFLLHFPLLSRSSSTMKKVRAFKLTKKLFTWCVRLVPRKKLRRSFNGRMTTFKRIFHCCSRLWRKATTMCTVEYLRGYARLNVGEAVKELPKGHMVVCVGGNGEEVRRVFVPVVYFNHPLFGNLLKEADEMYGHHHDGCITFPCHVSQFEVLKSRVAALLGGRNTYLKGQP